MTTWIVRPGDCLVTIAAEQGFLDPLTVYDRPENEDLRTMRPDPRVLLAGDEVFIPERVLGVLSRPTEQRHRVKVQSRATFLRLQFRNGDTPRAGVEYRVEYGNTVLTGTTASDGMLVQPIPAHLRQVNVVLIDHGEEEWYSIGVGYLDPVTDTSGVIQRLCNLGLALDIADVPPHIALEQAVRAFQSRQEIEVTGVMDDDSRQALVRAHGS